MNSVNTGKGLRPYWQINMSSNSPMLMGLQGKGPSAVGVPVCGSSDQKLRFDSQFHLFPSPWGQWSDSCAAITEKEIEFYWRVWTLKDTHDIFIVFHLPGHLLTIINIYWLPVVCQALSQVLGHSFTRDTQFLPPWSQHLEGTTSDQIKCPPRCQRQGLKK